MSRHTISHAEKLFHGNAQANGANGAKRGVPLTPIYQADLGAPVAADPDGILDGADANASAQSYSGSGLLLTTIDVPRNITCKGSLGADHVVTVTGADVYGDVMSEQYTLSGTVSQAGAKAFSSVTRVDVAVGAAGDTVDVGWGDVLGLPYRIGGAYDVLSAYADGTEELATSTLVAGDATTATASTGDVRGTIGPATATNGTVNYRVWLKINDATSRTGAYGVAQA